MNNRQHYSLDKIVSGLKDNDVKALDKLYNEYYPKLYRFCKGLIKIDHEIDDILQEVFVKIWVNRSGIKSPDTFNAYLYTITKNQVISFLRSKIHDPLFMNELKDHAIITLASGEEALEYQEMEDQLAKLIEQLPESSREIYKLSRNEGLSNKEIAEKLGISIKTVEYHMTNNLKFIWSTFKKTITCLFFL